jgi:hypothetical protein
VCVKERLLYKLALVIFKEHSSHKKEIRGFNTYYTWKHVELKLIDTGAEIKYSHLRNLHMVVCCHILLWNRMA